MSRSEDSSVHMNASRDLAFFESPVDFRSEVIYFLIVDRFNDGHSESDPRLEGSEVEGEIPLYDKSRQDWGKYWGGNLQGIINKIDYLKKLPTIMELMI